MSLFPKSKYFRRENFPVFIAITLFALVGAYFVLKSRADSSAYLRQTNFIQLEQGGERFGQYTTGQEFTIPLYTDFMTGGYSEATHGPVQLVLSIAFEPNHVQYLGYDCDYSSPCYSDQSFGGSVWGPPLGNVKDLICLDMPRGNNSSRINLVTLHLKALQNLSGDSHEQWSIFVWGFAEGTCVTNNNAKEVQWHSMIGNCGGNIGVYDCTRGLSFGTGPLGRTTPSDTTGDSTGQSPAQSAIVSGGGSTAKKQSTDPNNIPSTTSQGAEAKQPDLEASPFYDGKQYEPGSDPDLLGVNTTFSIAGHNLKYGWLYVVVAPLLVVIGSGLYAWKKKPQFIQKMKFWK